VFIRQGPLSTPADFHEEVRRLVIIEEKRQVLLGWPEVGSFRVSAHEIVVDPNPVAEDRLIGAFVSGAALGILLHLRGVVTLHASAVRVGTAGVAFMGPKGVGKSTMASTFCQHGASLVSDDVLVVDPETLQVHPGGRFCKLAPDAAASISQGPADQLVPVYERTQKRYWEPRNRHDARLPLAHIYLLEYSEEQRVEIQSVSKRDATLALIRNSYALRFLEGNIDGASHLEACGRIARHIPVRRLIRTVGLTHVDAVLQKVHADLA